MYAAIDDDGLPADHVRASDQGNYRCGHVDRVTYPAGRRPLAHQLFYRLVGIAEPLAKPTSGNKAGGNCVYTNLRTQGRGKPLGKRDDGRLRGGIGNRTTTAGYASQTSNVDNLAAAGIGQGRSCGAYALEHAAQIDRVDAFPILGLDGLEVVPGNEAGGAGIVDQHVETAEVGDRTLDHGPAGLIVGNIGKHGDAALAQSFNL